MLCSEWQSVVNYLCPPQEPPIIQKLLQGPPSGPTSSDRNSWQCVASVMPDTPFHLHLFCQLQGSDSSQAQSSSENGAQTPAYHRKSFKLGTGGCVPSVRQACTLIPGAPVFQDHASVSCHLFNEALWYGQWFGKLAKYKIQNKQDRRAQQYGYCPRNRASTPWGAHRQLALPRNNSGHQGAVTNAPVSK